MVFSPSFLGYMFNAESRSSRLFGAILMVAGCCIGAGMLGLPLVTAAAGLVPTAVLFIVSWLFMAMTGLLLLEVNLWFGTKVNLMTLAEHTLGKTARHLVGALFIFLFYCLMAAFLSAGGGLIAEFMRGYFHAEIPAYWGSGVLAGIFGLVIFLGSREVDLFNRLLMVGLGLSYIALLELGFWYVEWNHLSNAGWRNALPALPAMVISFGYHNLVPSLTGYLKGHVADLRRAILIGSAIPLVLYLLWDGLILGILPPGEHLQEAVDRGAMVTTLLREAVGGALVADILDLFSFFALVTSFLTVGFSFVDFFSDGLKIEKTYVGSLFLVLLVLVPPFFFSFLYPQLFLTALNYAGAFGAVVLFGMIPVAMVWKGRYVEKRQGVRLVPGGKVSLALIGGFAVMIFILQLKNEWGL